MGMVNEMVLRTRGFWWSSKQKGRGWAMLAWENLCLPKGMGGLGFQDFRSFNLALLGRQVWRLINNKDTLCFRVLSAKYFPDGNIFNAKRVDKLSYAWTSITAAAKAFNSGLGWHIGNGRNAKISQDKWGFEGLDGDSLRVRDGTEGDLFVHDLWLPDSCAWDENKVRNLYGANIGDHIIDISLIRDGPSDKMVWYHDVTGYYSSKSGYSWLTLRSIGYGPHRVFWRTIWKLRVLSKIRIFIWRVGHDIIPTNVKISQINHAYNVNCPKCENVRETLLHALRDCPKAHAVWTHGGIYNRILAYDTTSCID